MGVFTNAFGIGVGQGALLNLSNEYKNILLKVTTKPLSSVQKAQNSFVVREISEGRWNKYACLLPYAAGMPSAADAILWWNNPNRKGTLSATAPSYDIGLGFTGNGASAYIDTTYNYSTDGGGKFTLNDNAHGYWYANQRQVTSAGRSGGQPASTGNAILPFYATLLYMSNNCDYKTVSNTLGSQYLFTASRIASTGFKIYRNETDLGTVTQAAVSLGNFNAYGLWAGQTGINYATDTIGLQFYASSFTAADVLGLKNSWLQLLTDLAKIPSLSDDCAGTVIDANKWDTLNTNPLGVAFSQSNNNIIVDSIPGNFNVSLFANYVKCKDKRLFGTWKFTMSDLSYTMGFRREIGITDTSNLNRVFLIRESEGALLTLRIYQNNASVYSFLTDIDDFAICKIEISAANEIKLFSLVNDAWVQVGTTQTFKLGMMQLYIATQGGSSSRTTIGDVTINGANL